MDADSVVEVLRTRLLAVEGLYHVVWADDPTPYTPVTGTPYIEESFVFGSEHDTAVGVTPGERWRQVDESYQLMVCVPVDGDAGGLPAARGMANAIRAAFLASAISLPSGARLLTTTTQVQPPRITPNWLRLPVILSYTYVTNA